MTQIRACSCEHCSQASDDSLEPLILICALVAFIAIPGRALFHLIVANFA